MNDPAEMIKEFDDEHLITNIILIGEDDAVRNIVITNEEIED